MAGRSAILQKKLQELESELADVIRLPLDPTPSAAPRLRMAFDDIKQRLVFLNNLFRREIASLQPHDSDQLHEIGTRLAVLDAAFRRWNEWRLSVCSDCTQALLLRSDDSRVTDPTPEKPFATDGDVEREDCGQVVPYDDDEDEDDVRNCDRILDSEDFSGEKARKEEVAAAKEEKVWRKAGKYGGMFGCGMIVGAMCMVRLFFASYSHQFIEYEALFLPPT